MASSVGSTGGPSATQGQGQVVTDVTQIFDLLESNNPEVVQEVKDLIMENLNSTKENWLVSGLYEYYIQSGSARCSDILCGISKEPHDKYLIEKMTDGIKSTLKEVRRQTLILLGHAVCKQPSWLYKITHWSLFKELIKLLKTETDVVILLTGLLSMIMMLPIIPVSVATYYQDVFDVFGRIAMWTNTTHNIPKEHVLHLQVGLYSLFHRLYAMFPCNFLSYLRHNFGAQDKRTVFLHTIMPMLEKVKMHPNLVTATREAELSTARWQSREYHDIIAECAKISLDGYESGLPEEVPSGFTHLGANEDSGIGHNLKKSYGMEFNVGDVLSIPTSTLLSQTLDSTDISSLGQLIDDYSNTAPPTPLSATASSNNPFGQSCHPGKSSLPAETAMEATPENTPVKDRDRSHFKLPPHNTPAAIQLFGAKEELVLRPDRIDRPVPQTPPATPSSSVPSSPLPVTSTLARRDSIFDSSNFRREPLMIQRLQKVQMEQQAAQLQQQAQADATSTQLQQPIVASGNQSQEVSSRKVAIVAPHTVSNVDCPSPNVDFPNDSTEKFAGNGPLTPVSGVPSSTGPGLIDPGLSLITLDEEPNGLSECSTTACSSGGLHMADHKSMMAFVRKVSRLRYHSHCIAGSDFNTSLGPSPGTSPSSTSSNSGALSARARFMKRSLSCPDIKKPSVDDKEGTSRRAPKLPEVSEVGHGTGDQMEEFDEVGEDEKDGS